MRAKRDILFFLILFILISLFFTFRISDDDIWWHLAIGKYIISTGHIPQFDIFSYTIDPSKPWLVLSWLFALIFYIAYFLFGVSSLILTKALLGILCFSALYIRSQLYYEKNRSLVLLFLIIAIFSMRDRFLARPETFGFLFLSLQFIFLDLYIHKDTKFIIPLLINQILWVNFHPSFLSGAIIPLIYLAGFILEKKDSSDLKKLAFAIAAVFFSCLINPNGISRIIYIFNMFFNKQLYMVREYMPLSFSSYFSLKGVFVIIAFVLLILSIKKKHFTLTLTIIIFGYLGIRSCRFFNIFMISFLPLCPSYLFKYTNKPISFFENNQAAGKVLVVVVACILVIVSIFGKPSWGWGLEKFNFPQEAVDFLEKEDIINKTGGRIFNTFNFGGYLLWRLYPRHKVFIDSRIHLYFGRLLDTYFDIVTNDSLWSEVIKKYNIQVAIVRYPHLDQDKILYNYTSLLFDDKMWSLVYFDDVAIIYMRKNEKNQPLINKYQFKYIKPQNLNPAYLDIYLGNSSSLYELMDEINRAFTLCPDSFRIYFLRAYINSRIGKHKDAISDLIHALNINPDLKAAKNILKQIYGISNIPFHSK